MLLISVVLALTISLTCSFTIPTSQQVVSIQKSVEKLVSQIHRNSKISDSPCDNSLGLKHGESQQDYYARFRFWAFISNYDSSTDTWVNTTEFGRFYYENVNNVSISRVNIVGYNSIGVKVDIDKIENEQDGTTTTISEVNGNGPPTCTISSLDNSKNTRNMKKVDLGYEYFSFDEPELNWIYWGSSLNELCYEMDVLTGTTYITGYDLFENDEIRIETQSNDTYNSITIYDHWNYNSFDSSYITVPSNIDCSSDIQHPNTPTHESIFESIKRLSRF